MLMAQALGITVQQSAPTIQDPVYDSVAADITRQVAIPMLPVLLDTVKNSWGTISTMPPMSKSLISI